MTAKHERDGAKHHLADLRQHLRNIRPMTWNEGFFCLFFSIFLGGIRFSLKNEHKVIFTLVQLRSNSMSM